MTNEQVEKVAHILYDPDCLRGIRSQRWSVGAEKKRELYRAKARARLHKRPFSSCGLSELGLASQMASGMVPERSPPF